MTRHTVYAARRLTRNDYHSLEKYSKSWWGKEEQFVQQNSYRIKLANSRQFIYFQRMEWHRTESPFRQCNTYRLMASPLPLITSFTPGFSIPSSSSSLAFMEAESSWSGSSWAEDEEDVDGMMIKGWLLLIRCLLFLEAL